MATTVERTRIRERLPHRGPASARDGGNVAALVGVFAAVGAVVLFWRVYQQVYAWKYMDATSPEFRRVWIGLLVGQWIAIGGGAAVWFAWLVRRPCRTCDSERARLGDVSPGHEAGHIWRLWLHLVGFTLVLFFAASHFAEQDAAWHQVAVRDTAFTPSHVVLFFGTFPLAIVLAIGSYLYGRTRIPRVYRDRGFPLSFGLIIAGTLLLLFQVAFNEWGHSFWIAEEVFSAPLHWPFVFFAYLVAATFAVWFQTLARLFTLIDREAAQARDGGPGESEGESGGGDGAGAGR